MRVVCPSCQAAYEVPDAAFGNGPKRLRCARCKQEWLAEPAALAAPIMRPPTTAPDLSGPLERMAEAGVGARPGAVPAMQAEAAPGPGAALAVTGPAGRGDALVALPERAVGAGPRPASIGGIAASGSRARLGTAVVVLAWVLSCAVLAAGGAAAVIWRGEVMQAWPPSQRAYLALGLR